MTRRSPARLLAPLALVAVAVALFAVVTGGSDPEREAGPAAAPTTTTGAAGDDGKRKERRTPRRYTVKPGDTPSGIAEKNDMTVEELLELNPDLDAQSLTPGQRLRLR